MAEKIYVGQGKIVGQYGNIGASVCIDDLLPHATTAKNGKKYVNIIISKMKNPNEWGKTHSIVIDDWKPDSFKANRTPEDDDRQPPDTNDASQFPADGNDIDVSDIPF